MDFLFVCHPEQSDRVAYPWGKDALFLKGSSSNLATPLKTYSSFISWREV
jgi:hypothetical protein